MADIFGGAQMPAWLANLAKPTDPELTGHVIGTALGAGLNAIERDPNSPDGERKGFKEGIAEARMNQSNPMWRLQAAQTQSAMMARAAQAESAYALANERINETKAWMQDAPKLSPWLTARPEDRKTLPTPTANSKTGMTLLEKTRDQDARYFAAQDANSLRKQQVDNNTVAAKSILDDAKKFNSTLLTVTDPATRSKIRGMTKNGVPTAEAWEALDAAPKTTSTKPLSTVGKLEADRDNAIKSGAPQEVVSAYDAAIKKATESSANLYADAPKVIEVEGKKFLQWGKQLRDLSSTGAKEKAEISLMTSRIRTLQTELSKDPKNADIINQLSAEQKKFNRYFEPKQTSTSPKIRQVTPQTQTQTQPATDSGLNFDDFQKWKQSR